jgi:hypothetical protein
MARTHLHAKLTALASLPVDLDFSFSLFFSRHFDAFSTKEMFRESQKNIKSTFYFLEAHLSINIFPVDAASVFGSGSQNEKRRKRFLLSWVGRADATGPCLLLVKE